MNIKNFHIISLFLPLATLILLGSAKNYTPQASRNLATIKAIYNLTVFPNNVPFITQGFSVIPAGLFNANATGRVSPLGNFSGFEESAEYFFGLAPTPQAPFYAAFATADVVEFSSCGDVASSVVTFDARVLNQSRPDFGKHVTYLKEVSCAGTASGLKFNQLVSLLIRVRMMESTRGVTLVVFSNLAVLAIDCVLEI